MPPFEPSASPTIEDLRAFVDQLEGLPVERRTALLRGVSSTLIQRWTKILGSEAGLRSVVADLFLLGTVDIGESSRLAHAIDFESISAGAEDSRRPPVATALRQIFEAAVWLGASQRALEEARAALICRVPRIAFGCVDASGDPALSELGVLLMRAREGALGLGEALHLLAPTLSGADRFARDRAAAACSAAHHFALHAARDIILGSVRLAGPSGLAGETALGRLSRAVIAMLATDATLGSTAASVARDFMRKAL